MYYSIIYYYYKMYTILLNDRNWDKESYNDSPSLTKALIKTNYKTFNNIFFMGLLSV